ncbi:MAG: hypothetical protein EA353_06645 [Puniceicoccaceae bacterium]|nr:MAG: hypothetical protein EA353_06645 [Puniceicoccaceae bacterium]
MEFDLETLARDWIDGISGRAFRVKFDTALSRLGAVPVADRGRGALLCERDPVEFAAVFFAAASLRFPITLANPKWGEREWGEFARLLAPAVTFGQAGEGPNAFRSASSQAKALSDLEAGTILIPTGGSSGGVKLAIHSWASLSAACEGVQAFLGGGPIDSCCVLPLYHVSGLMQLLRAYYTGGRIRFDEDAVAGRCLSYVPTQLQRALRDPQRVRELSTARAIFVGGAALAEGVADRARELKLPVIPVYGMTETAAMVAAIPRDDFLADPKAGAVVFGKTRVEIEADGRIRIQSPALFKGYQGHDPLDLSRGYLTDDEGYLDQAGRLHVLGRVDRLINSGGEKIDPREVEAAICQIDGVDEALAVGVPDSEWGQKLVVYYTGHQLSSWKSALKEHVASYKIPKEMHWVEVLPLDEKGKRVKESTP